MVPFGKEIDRAILFAVSAHEGQYRKREKAGIYLPYITHPLEVLKTIWKWETINREMAIAAILHDTLEDTYVKADMIKYCFGKEVLYLVQELTFSISPTLSADIKKELKNEYLESFVNKSMQALVIKIADRLCNVTDFLLDDRKYALRYLEKANTLMYIFANRYQEIKKEFGENSASTISKDIYLVTNEVKEKQYS